MKKLILLAGLYCLQPSLHAAPFRGTVKTHKAPITASDRAISHFKENYAWVQDAAWYNAPDNSIYCLFRQGKEVNRVFYNERGYWLYTLISYPPSCLQKNVKELVSNNFAGYQISYVNEVRSEYSEPVYMINIENAENIKVIKVTGDEIEVEQALQKS